ncbi:hypothetical protein FNH13_08300 [Ornithinimicrobium ciconiae]|uniref:DUF2631 domain-containing protein n=1 Tax=Ornithinimicrobium ciconiae TaxID=2594265 RepID=A0A516G9Z4_9MICO|nr:hypothetical protein [Ornithinimicrobium ciconiae]QDO88343.1 hypothetical protein FNH13_08300 [Ornithinimicrobium ciconiae]
MTDTPDPQPEQEPVTLTRQQTARNKRQAWLYIVIGVALGVVAVIGLLADDAGFLDWLLLALAIINLTIGVMALTRPQPRLGSPDDS